jgi:hypothetical protein
VTEDLELSVARKVPASACEESFLCEYVYISPIKAPYSAWTVAGVMEHLPTMLEARVQSPCSLCREKHCFGNYLQCAPCPLFVLLSSGCDFWLDTHQGANPLYSLITTLWGHWHCKCLSPVPLPRFVLLLQKIISVKGETESLSVRQRKGKDGTHPDMDVGIRRQVLSTLGVLILGNKG